MSKKKKDPVVVDENNADEIETIEIESDAISSDEDESPEEETVELDPIKALEKDLQKTKNELAEQKDSFVRLQAETDNFRKRLSREKKEFSQYANERLFKELIPIFDNLERALEDPSNDTKSLKEGLEMILKQFSAFLEKEKVEPIKAIGEKFDPMVHEALTSEEANEHEENTIISEFVKGYTINNRVLRPSQVVISKKPSPESENDSKEESEEYSDKEESPAD
ncbi:MAG: nucleotide exchange factor GrpE [Nitrospinales bacterium]|nr:nucleotide exchange factor GrpE [Nitrospinales bacterium]